MRGGLSPGGAPEVARSKYVCALKGELTRLVDKLSMGKTKRGVKENPSFWPITSRIEPQLQRWVRLQVDRYEGGRLGAHRDTFSMKSQEDTQAEVLKRELDIEI